VSRKPVRDTFTQTMNIIMLFFLGLFLASCGSIVRTRDGAESVQLFFIETADNNLHIHMLESNCEFIGEVTGSEGHWYSDWFISSKLLVQGAMNDLKNNAYEKGGNIVIVYHEFDFATSVTLLGQTYKCSTAERSDKARF